MTVASRPRTRSFPVTVMYSATRPKRAMNSSTVAVFDGPKGNESAVGDGIIPSG